jgi:DNA-binding MarR family transcriptional regulator
MAQPLESPRVNRVDLKAIDPADSSLELMYFGLKGMTREADELLAAHGFGRAHHRILFVIARSDGISVGALRDNLGISAQALHRPLKQLQEGGFVAVTRNPEQHRSKGLHLTESGRAIEHAASEAERRVMRGAFAQAGDAAAKAWAEVMKAIATSA